MLPLKIRRRLVSLKYKGEKRKKFFGSGRCLMLIFGIFGIISVER
jgi:hypothetical protein